ncbi:amidase family protein, partial [Streptomyces sp. NPDC047072]|uniref:allophanate hydrolase-related protein n=1 Tax=Streptomyces sp. NPDC047072 TaxID=3154809 RepID=UPI00340E266C
RLAGLRERALAELADADALLLPTTPGHPTLAEVAADPLATNARLGRFTNSTNLFDLAAAAIPAGAVNGLPFGVMLIGPAHTDERLTRIATLLHPETSLAVVGAHLTGQPLNPQLLSLGARYDRTTTTAPVYSLHALNTTPPKPGLVHVGEGGAQIETEIWRLPAEGLGRLLTTLPRPMTLGSVQLSDGTKVPGFLCEPSALTDAKDITSYRGWRPYLNAE